MSMRNVTGDAVLTGTRTATVASPRIDAGPGVADILVLVQVTAVAGTSPTLTVSVEQSVDGVTWTAIPASAAPVMSTLGNTVCNAAVPQQFARVVATIGGTTPSFTFRASAMVFAE